MIPALDAGGAVLSGKSASVAHLVTYVLRFSEEHEGITRLAIGYSNLHVIYRMRELRGTSSSAYSTVVMLATQLSVSNLIARPRPSRAAKSSGAVAAADLNSRSRSRL